MTRYSTAALIPARGGSKGISRKNVKDLGGHPLIAYSIAACKMSQHIGDIYVSTEDSEIADIAGRYGAKVPFIRPLQYAADNSTDHDVLKHFFANIDIDHLVFVRPTTPLRESSQLDLAIEKFFDERRELSSIRSVHEIPESPYKLFKIENGYFRGFFDDFEGIKNYTNLPRQHFPRAYQPNGYIDIVKRSVVESGTSFGDEIVPYITSFVAEVDFPHQFSMLETEIETRGHRILDYLNEYYRDKI